MCISASNRKSCEFSSHRYFSRRWTTRTDSGSLITAYLHISHSEIKLPDRCKPVLYWFETYFLLGGNCLDMYRVPQYSTQVHSHSRLTYFGFFILNIKYQHNMDERFINLQKDLCDASRASASVTWLTNSHWHDTGISRSTLHISSKHHKPQLPQRQI